MYSVLAPGAIGVSVDFEESVQLAAHHKFGGVVTDVGYLMENGPLTVVQMLEERGLRPGGWGLPFAATAPDREFEEGLEKLPEVAEACSRAADGRCFTWLPPASDEMPYEEMFEFLRERLTRVAQVLDEYEVRLGLEFIGPPTSRASREYEFIHTMDGMLELCSAVGTGNVGLLMDAWHLFTSGGEMDDVLALSDRQVVTVHINDAPEGVPVEELKDNVRCLPGETGRIDARRFLECLGQIGYTGPVMAEPFSDRVNQMEPDEAIRATRQAIEEVWPD